MSLKHSYTLIAPVYDAIIRRPLGGARRRSLAALPADKPCRILVDGIGTGRTFLRCTNIWEST